MNLKDIQGKYNTEEKCRMHLEKLRWNGIVKCVHCNSSKKIHFIKSEHRHRCNNCKKSFSVLHDTIFEGSKFPLTDWFLIIGLMLNAKKGISAKEIERNLGCSYKTAWYIAMRIRCAMVDQNIELENIVEMDEAYLLGGKRKANNKPTISGISDSKRGRGTIKIPVVGIVERKGQVVLKVTEKLTSKVLLKMLNDNVNLDKAIVITDEFPAYKSFDNIVEHLTINHSKQFSKGAINTNTIEGFWAIVKNSIRGSYVSLSRKYLPLYLVQAQYIYNRRDSKIELFEEFLKLSVKEEKVMLNYKPVKKVDNIVYKDKSK